MKTTLAGSRRCVLNTTRLLSLFLATNFYGLVLLQAAPEENKPTPTITGAVSLEAVQWTLTELKAKPLQAVATEGRKEVPTLQFDAEKKRASGFSGVNRYFGSYERQGEKLKFGPLASTRMAGPPEAMALEQDFLQVLDSVTQFRILDPGTLELLQSDGTVAACFKAPEAAKK